MNSFKNFCITAQTISNLHSLMDDANVFHHYRYDKKGKRIENITDWGLEQFMDNYKDKKIKKEDIFQLCIWRTS